MQFNGGGGTTGRDGRPSGHLALRGCASCGFPWENQLGGDFPRLQKGGSARGRRGPYGGTLPGVCGTPLPSAPPAGLCNLVASFFLQAKRDRLDKSQNNAAIPFSPPQTQTRGRRFACLGGIHLPRDGRKGVPALPSSIPGPKRLSRVRPGAGKAAPAPEGPPLPGGSPSPRWTRGPRAGGVRSASPAVGSASSGRRAAGRRAAMNRGLTGFLQTPSHPAAPDRCGPGCRGWK